MKNLKDSLRNQQCDDFYKNSIWITRDRRKCKRIYDRRELKIWFRKEIYENKFWETRISFRKTLDQKIGKNLLIRGRTLNRLFINPTYQGAKSFFDPTLI